MIPALRIGGADIPTYWLMYGVGIAAMLASTLQRRHGYKLNKVKSVLFILLLALCGLLGVKILYCIENLAEVLEHGLTLGGMSFFGAVFLVPVFMIPIGLMFRLKPRQTMDLCAPDIAVMIGCMRIGCFLGGCCGGWRVTLFGISFCWPTQAMESIGDFILFGILSNIDQEKTYSGKLYPLFMVFYGVLRFIIEFLRDTEKNIFFLSRGQWYSLVGIIIGVSVLVRCEKKNAGSEVEK